LWYIRKLDEELGSGGISADGNCGIKILRKLAEPLYADREKDLALEPKEHGSGPHELSHEGGSIHYKAKRILKLVPSAERRNDAFRQVAEGEKGRADKQQREKGV